MSVSIELILGDITEQSVDAIVNAANTALLPGGGVDDAITRAAGPEALADRERLISERGNPPLATGDSVETVAGDLDASWIIHTAGPVYSGTPRDGELLADCHRSALRVADALDARRVAFPAISTGAYGYPVGQAAPIAISTVMEAETAVDQVRFVLFSESDLEAFRVALDALGGG